jgi:phage terminase Nu1 subunit (DNA packaging protein)
VKPLSDKQSKPLEKIITTSELSEILGLSTRRIGQLEKDGALTKVNRGRYDLVASIRSYIDYRIEKEKGDDELDAKVETALWTRARRQKTELELNILKGEVHRSQDVKRVMNNMLTAFRTRILAIPTRVASQLIGQQDMAIVQDKIKKVLNEALNELKDYDPNVFYAESKDKLSIEEDEDNGLIEDPVVEAEKVKHNARKKGKNRKPVS